MSFEEEEKCRKRRKAQQLLAITAALLQGLDLEPSDPNDQFADILNATDDEEEDEDDG